MTSFNDGSNPKKRIACLVENGFEDSEYQVPCTALQKAGAEIVNIGSRMNDEYKGKRGKVTVTPDGTAAEVRSEDFDAILIPGGDAPDQIRRNPNAVRLVIDGMAQGKLVAAVCHGPQVLIEADALRGKQTTGFKAIRKDIQNAGATYINEPVVIDGNLIAARQPGDLPMFTATLLSFLGLSIQGMNWPEASDRTFAWWKLGEAWGGSSRLDIVNTLNTALVGERYTVAAFEEYEQHLQDPQLSLLLREVMTTKRLHIDLLESRLKAFEEQVSWQALGSEAFATLQSWLQSTTGDMEILRRALGDLQTGLYDAGHLSAKITDPASVQILEQVEDNLRKHEQLFAELYRNRSGETVSAPTPTTIAATS
ncbi:MAG: DJ-1/PfpI/YhbO family deglycase/protease [Limnospira sp.]